MLSWKKTFHRFLSLSPTLSFSPFSSNPTTSQQQIALLRNPRNKTIRVTSSRFRPDSDLSSPSATIPDSISPEVNSICSLLCSHTDGNKNLDNLLKDFRNELTSNLVLETLLNYRQLGRRNTLEFFSWAGFQMGFRFDDSVVEYMADFLGRRKLFDDIKCLLKTVSSQNGRVSCRTVSICIRFLGREGRVEEALSLFWEMESELNCVPDNLVFNNMLCVLCKKGTSFESIEIAFAIFRRIKSPDAYSYSNMIVGLCNCGRVETAHQVFYEMGSSGLLPTKTAVNKLIGELCELSKKEGCIERVRVKGSRRAVNILVPNVAAKTSIQPASEVFWAVLHLGLLPSAFVVTQLIEELCRLNKLDEALEILKVVEERQLGSIEECFAIVIRTLCDVRRTNEACKLFERLVSLGLKPKLVVYNAIICALCKVGNLEEAEKHFAIMNKKRCSPDNVTFTALINAYCLTQKWEAAYELLMEMLGLGWCPHSHTYASVDRLVKQHGREDLSLKLEGKLETQLLHKYCKEGQLEAAYDKLSSMLAKGFYPPIYTRDIFEGAFKKYGKWKLARDLLEKMDQVFIQSSSKT